MDGTALGGEKVSQAGAGCAGKEISGPDSLGRKDPTTLMSTHSTLGYERRRGRQDAHNNFLVAQYKTVLGLGPVVPLSISCSQPPPKLFYRPNSTPYPSILSSFDSRSIAIYRDSEYLHRRSINKTKRRNDEASDNREKKRELREKLSVRSCENSLTLIL